MHGIGKENTGSVCCGRRACTWRTWALAKKAGCKPRFLQIGGYGRGELWFVDYCWCGRRIQCVLESGVCG